MLPEQAQKAELARQDAEIARAAERVADVERQRRWAETVQRKDIARLLGACPFLLLHACCPAVPRR